MLTGQVNRLTDITALSLTRESDYCISSNSFIPKTVLVCILSAAASERKESIYKHK